MLRPTLTCRCTQCGADREEVEPLSKSWVTTKVKRGRDTVFRATTPCPQCGSDRVRIKIRY